MVSLVHGNWAEVKTLAIGTVTTGMHATDLSYCSRLADAEAFGEIATRETHRRGTRRAGIHPFVDGQRLDAVRILDFPRAVKQLAKAAKAVFGAGTRWQPVTGSEPTAHTMRPIVAASVLATLLRGMRRALSRSGAKISTGRASRPTGFTRHVPAEQPCAQLPANRSF